MISLKLNCKISDRKGFLQMFEKTHYYIIFPIKNQSLKLRILSLGFEKFRIKK